MFQFFSLVLHIFAHCLSKLKPHFTIAQNLMIAEWTFCRFFLFFFRCWSNLKNLFFLFLHFTRQSIRQIRRESWNRYALTNQCCGYQGPCFLEFLSLSEANLHTVSLMIVAIDFHWAQWSDLSEWRSEKNLLFAFFLFLFDSNRVAFNTFVTGEFRLSRATDYDYLRVLFN